MIRWVAIALVWTVATFGLVRFGLGSLLSEMVFTDMLTVVYLVFGAVVLVSGTRLHRHLEGRLSEETTEHFYRRGGSGRVPFAIVVVWAAAMAACWMAYAQGIDFGFATWMTAALVVGPPVMGLYYAGRVERAAGIRQKVRRIADQLELESDYEVGTSRLVLEGTYREIPVRIVDEVVNDTRHTRIVADVEELDIGTEVAVEGSPYYRADSGRSVDDNRPDIRVYAADRDQVAEQLAEPSFCEKFREIARWSEDVRLTEGRIEAVVVAGFEDDEFRDRIDEVVDAAIGLGAGGGAVEREVAG